MRRIVVICLYMTLLARGVLAGAADEVAPETTDATAIDNFNLPKVYEIVEFISLSGPSVNIEVHSNIAVSIQNEKGVITAQLLGKTNRQKTLDTDPKVDSITIKGDKGDRSYVVPALRCSFEFGIFDYGDVNIKGLRSSAATKEAAYILSQGPSTNTIKPLSNDSYSIITEVNSRRVSVNGKQSTGDLKVDWALDPDDNALNIRGEGWLMPLSYELPSFNLNRNITLECRSEMEYASARLGPERETRVNTTIMFKREKLTYIRSVELRPLAIDPPKTRARGLSRATDFGGNAALWGRTATLMTLGVQNVAGVRETGLGIWLGQLATDALAGKYYAKVVSSVVNTSQLNRTRSGIKKLAASVPSPSPLAGSVESLSAMRNLIHIEAAMSMAEFATTMGAAEDSNVGILPHLELNIRRRLGESWRMGAGLDVVWMDTNTRNPSLSWYDVLGMIRFDKIAPRSALSFSLGYGVMGYDARNLMGTSTSYSILAPAVAFEYERSVGRSSAIALKGRYVIDAELSSLYVQPSIRWRFGRSNAFQIQLLWTQVMDSGAPEELSAEGMGIGAGTVIRW